jgi:hypothetical protein
LSLIESAETIHLPRALPPRIWLFFGPEVRPSLASKRT